MYRNGCCVLTTHHALSPLLSLHSGPMSSYGLLPRAAMLLMILFIISACRSPAKAQTLNDGDYEALEAIAAHWPNVSIGPAWVPWTNWSNPCAFSGVQCITLGDTSYVTFLGIEPANGFLHEEPGNVLPYLGANFSSYFTRLQISNSNLSSAAQSSLFVPSLTYLSIFGGNMSALGDVSHLHNLTSFTVSMSPLTHVSAFPSSPSLKHWSAVSMPQLTSLDGAWASNSGLAIQIMNAPLLTSIPSFAAVSTLTSLDLNDVGLTQLPTFPANPSVQMQVSIKNMPNLTSLPSDLSHVHISSFVLAGTSLSVDPLPNLNGSNLSTLTLQDLSLTSLPAWTCNLPAQASLSVTNSNLSYLSECLTHVKFSYFGMGDLSQLQWIPRGLFNQQASLNSLQLWGLPDLIINSSLTSFLWNLPSITQLALPPQYVAAGIPPLGSRMGSTPAPGSGSVDGSGEIMNWCSGTCLDVRVVGAPLMNAPIPDSYFRVFTNATFFAADDLAINGTLPSSTALMTSLVSFSMKNNSLTGTLSQAITQLQSLTVLRLNNNQLSGFIPDLSKGFSNSTAVFINLSANYFDLCKIPAIIFWEKHPLYSKCTVGGYCRMCPLLWAGCTVDACVPPPPTSFPPPHLPVPITAPPPTSPAPRPSSGTPTAIVQAPVSEKIWWIVLAAVLSAVLLILAIVVVSVIARRFRERPVVRPQSIDDASL